MASTVIGRSGQLAHYWSMYFFRYSLRSDSTHVTEITATPYVVPYTQGSFDSGVGAAAQSRALRPVLFRPY